MSLRIAIIDDYLHIAAGCADWSSLPEGAVYSVFHDAVAGEDEATTALAPFDVIVAMCERTPFPESLLARLPRLRYLVFTGGRNTVIDRAACERRGIRVSGTRGDVTGWSGTAELTLGLILAVQKRLVQENAPDSPAAGKRASPR